MKRNTLKKLLGLAVLAAVTMTAPAVLAKERESETEAVSETETENETETEMESESETEILDIQVEVGELILVIKNESGIVIKEAVFEDPEKAETETETETENETEENDAVIGTLKFIEEEGIEHIYEEVDLSVMTEAVLVEEDGFLFIKYLNEEEEEKTVAETAEEKEFEEPVTMYCVNDVYIRAEADADSEALGVAYLGKEYTVTAASPKWYKIEQEDITGYVSRSYLSKDKESADAAVQAEEAAVAQAQAAAAAAAAQAAQNQNGQTQNQGGVYEIKREKFDDCDGSGHGYYKIYYSDGTVKTEDY